MLLFLFLTLCTVPLAFAQNEVDPNIRASRIDFRSLRRHRGDNDRVTQSAADVEEDMHLFRPGRFVDASDIMAESNEQSEAFPLIVSSSFGGGGSSPFDDSGPPRATHISSRRVARRRLLRNRNSTPTPVDVPAMRNLFRNKFNPLPGRDLTVVSRSRHRPLTPVVKAAPRAIGPTTTTTAEPRVWPLPFKQPEDPINPPPPILLRGGNLNPLNQLVQLARSTQRQSPAVNTVRTFGPNTPGGSNPLAAQFMQQFASLAQQPNLNLNQGQFGNQGQLGSQGQFGGLGSLARNSFVSPSANQFGGGGGGNAFGAGNGFGGGGAAPSEFGSGLHLGMSPIGPPPGFGGDSFSFGTSSSVNRPPPPVPSTNAHVIQNVHSTSTLDMQRLLAQSTASNQIPTFNNVRSTALNTNEATRNTVNNAAPEARQEAARRLLLNAIRNNPEVANWAQQNLLALASGARPQDLHPLPTNQLSQLGGSLINQLGGGRLQPQAQVSNSGLGFGSSSPSTFDQRNVASLIGRQLNLPPITNHGHPLVGNVPQGPTNVAVLNAFVQGQQPFLPRVPQIQEFGNARPTLQGRRSPKLPFRPLDETFIDIADVIVGGGGSLESQVRLVDAFIGLDNAHDLNALMAASGLQEPLYKTLAEASQSFLRSETGQQLFNLAGGAARM